MIAIGTERMSRLIEDGIVNLKKFILGHQEITHVETSLDYDSDIFLRGKLPESTTILTRVQCVGDLEVTMDFHRLAIGSSNLVVLLPSTLDWNDERVRGEIDWVQKVYSTGMWGVTSVDQIEEYKLATRWYPEFVTFQINPLCYPKTLIDFCREHGIKTVGHGIFGGVWGGYVRSMFPDAFLYDFAQSNVDIVVVSGEDPYFLGDMAERKVNPSKLFQYGRDLNKLPARSIPPRKVHGVGSVSISGFGTAEYDSGDLRWTVKKPELKIESPSILWEDTDLPWDLGENDPSSYHRYHVEPWLDENYSPSWWKKVYTKVGHDFWMIKLISRYWFIPKEHMFWLVRGKLIKTPLSEPDVLINEHLNKENS